MEFDAGIDADAVQQVEAEEAMVVNPEEAKPEEEVEEEVEAEEEPEVEVKKGGAKKPPVARSASAASAAPASAASAIEEIPLAASAAEIITDVAEADVIAPIVAADIAKSVVQSEAIKVSLPTIASISESVSGAVSGAVSGVVDTVESVVLPKKRPPVGRASVMKPVEEVGAVEASVEQRSQRILSYKESVRRAMEKLDRERTQFLQLDTMNPSARLQTYSPKLDHMIRRIDLSKGSNLVYSQFKTVEGLGVLGIALKANRYVEIKIEGSDASPIFSEETEASFRKGPAAKEKRFITFTGEGSKDRRALILNLFNGNLSKLPTDMRMILEESGYNERLNQYGEICWVIGITGAGAEGISLKCCRSVHIMEPYWNNVRLDQVKGRAIRICSHKDLPYKDREVEIYTYYTVFSEEQMRGDQIDFSIRDADKDRITGRIMTSDENVYFVGKRKDEINQKLLTIMKETAVDCNLNAADNDGVQCMNLYGRPDQYLFDPNLEVDKIITSVEFKEDDRKEDDRKEDMDNGARRIARELGSSIRTSSKVINVPVCTFKGTKYLLQPKKGAGGLAFHMYLMTDTDFRNVVGEVGVNPGTGNFNGAVPKIY